MFKYADSFSNFSDAVDRLVSATAELEESKANGSLTESDRELARHARLRVMKLYNDVLTELQNRETKS